MSGRMFRTIRMDLSTAGRSELLEITHEVRAAVRRAGLREGFVIAYVPHTTAGICINENADPSVKDDVLAKLNQLIPRSEPYYRHAEGNSDSHLKTILTGNSVTVLVEAGELMLGQWQGIYLAEFDGPRRREVWLKLFEPGPAPPEG